MKASAVLSLVIVISLLMQVVESKVSRCKEVLNKYDRDFFYCTKFSVG
jgi:hypothetical protein